MKYFDILSGWTSIFFRCCWYVLNSCFKIMFDPDTRRFMIFQWYQDISSNMMFHVHPDSFWSPCLFAQLLGTAPRPHAMDRAPRTISASLTCRLVGANFAWKKLMDPTAACVLRAKRRVAGWVAGWVAGMMTLLDEMDWWLWIIHGSVMDHSLRFFTHQ